ncbi:peptide-methionine (S)-S-oxide reductase [Motilibacter peucedani]|uniref:Peptide methionine sulfoxide reductase MsrA n=1 Tax=Motilibacter peucedani TaxID=598650 RepID=A0A420XV34_9ACTN|nr:peptide-methionine (S)-S-oxide reductase MsrA [Motilibacter peucedani]RKS80713.1 peptide-methionine (S)-S-oxide reductase [Motilibacter peucedani]
MLFGRSKPGPVSADTALPGRASRPYSVPARHTVLGNPIEGPFPEGLEVAYFAMGCFWGAERAFWEVPGVWSTAAGYQGGFTTHPTYDETCTGLTGHTEAVQVVYDPAKVTYAELLKVFWESHDPTQGDRQGNDVGTQYRSAAYWTTEAQREALEASKPAFEARLREAGFGPVTTETGPAGPFYYAEDYHQQYLDKVPGGYCGLGGTGVSCPVGVLGA